MKYFSTLGEKFRVSARSCNILYLFVLDREDMGFKLVAEQIGRVPTLDVFCLKTASSGL